MSLMDGAPAPLELLAEPAASADCAPTPCSSVETEVAAIWAEVLGLEEVAPSADFFELGGDSLSAALILTRVQRRFRFRLSEGDLFTARTVRGLCALVRRAAHGSGNFGPPLVPIAGPRTRFPATSAQRRLWILDHIIPNPEVYNVCYLVRIDGALDAEALRAALEQVEERHETLRVHFETEDGLPVQVVGGPRRFELPSADLGGLPAAEAHEFVVCEATADAALRIALDGTRLWRVKLYRTGDGQSYLWLNMHHTIADGWSLGVFFADLEEYYEAAVAGGCARLAPLGIQFGDYALWEQQFRDSPAYREQLDWWKRVLAPPIPSVDLPFAKPRPRWQTYKGERIQFTVPAKLVSGIDRLCRGASVTRFMVGLAAFQTVLNRYGGMDTLLLGTPVANRARGEVEPLVGLFVNTVVLRTDLSGEPTFRDLLDRVRQTRLEALARQDVSLEALIEELRPARDPSRQPFFQAAFYYQNVTLVPERFSRFKVSVVPIHNGTAMFDLRMVLEDGPFGGLWGWVEFNTDLVDEAHVEQMVGHVLTVMEAAAANPTTPISQLPLLSPAERRRIVHEWNRTAGDYPAADCLPDAFARHATETPNAPALIVAGKTISYRQLEQRSNRLARYLRARGVKPRDLVAVCLKRSADMVAAVLAVTKVGAAYVPLDPAYPKERLAFMLEDTKTPVVLTEQHLRERIPGDFPNVICLERDWKGIDREGRDNLANRVAADDLAYVMYTSGSTGQPKGVRVRHRGVTRLVLNTNYVQLERTDRLGQISNISFDAATFEIWGALLNGGQLVGITNDIAISPKEFARELKEKGVTTIFLTTALFAQIAIEAPGAF
ncbi:MAG TPA: condensation domain-containing protein, partial [Gemmataceae bacterium]|nr:condensation domain-containing protein [Gemmataceae bacterium]